MNYKNAKVEMVTTKDRFGTRYTYKVIVSDGSNEEEIYLTGNEKDALNAKFTAEINLRKFKEGN